MFGKNIFNIHNSGSLAILTSVFLIFVVLINAFFFDFFSTNVFCIIVLLISVTLFSYIFVRWIVDKFIYDKIKLIYKNISDNKATPGYLEGVDLDKVDIDGLRKQVIYVDVDPISMFANKLDVNYLSNK